MHRRIASLLLAFLVLAAFTVSTVGAQQEDPLTRLTDLINRLEARIAALEQRLGQSSPTVGSGVPVPGTGMPAAAGVTTSPTCPTNAGHIAGLLGVSVSNLMVHGGNGFIYGGDFVSPRVPNGMKIDNLGRSYLPGQQIPGSGGFTIWVLDCTATRPSSWQDQPAAPAPAAAAPTTDQSAGMALCPPAKATAAKALGVPEANLQPHQQNGFIYGGDQKSFAVPEGMVVDNLGKRYLSGHQVPLTGGYTAWVTTC